MKCCDESRGELRVAAFDEKRDGVVVRLAEEGDEDVVPDDVSGSGEVAEEQLEGLGGVGMSEVASVASSSAPWIASVPAPPPAPPSLEAAVAPSKGPAMVTWAAVQANRSSMRVVCPGNRPPSTHAA